MNKKTNIILILIMLAILVWAIYVHNWYILIANVCIISAVLIDDKANKMLLRADINYKLVRNVKRFVIPILYAGGAISIILFGLSKFYWN